MDALGLEKVKVPPGGMHAPGRLPDKPSVTIIRWPDEWFASYFANGLILSDTYCPALTELGMVARVQGAGLSLQDQFEQIVKVYLEVMPGHISEKVFPAYESDHVIRLEEADTDLMRALDLLEIAYKPSDILDVGVVARSGNRVTWPSDLRESFMEVEIGACIRGL